MFTWMVCPVKCKYISMWRVILAIHITKENEILIIGVSIDPNDQCDIKIRILQIMSLCENYVQLPNLHLCRGKC